MQSDTPVLIHIRKQSSGIIPYPTGWLRWMLRSPMWLYQLGLGWLIGWIPLLILTTRGRKSGDARYAVVEWRRHGKRLYIVSGWGKRPNWYQNLCAAPIVTVQLGGNVMRARATTVTDRNEAARVLYMFRKNSPFYDVLLASMSTADQINFTTLPQVSGEFTIVRLEPEDGALELPILPQLPGWTLPVGLGILGMGMLARWVLRR
jgi:deazaflavin-dependent oxidoreductase (nitroreductase family)